jgi:hypothetical protein
VAKFSRCIAAPICYVACRAILNTRLRRRSLAFFRRSVESSRPMLTRRAAGSNLLFYISNEIRNSVRLANRGGTLQHRAHTRLKYFCPLHGGFPHWDFEFFRSKVAANKRLAPTVAKQYKNQKSKFPENGAMLGIYVPRGPDRIPSCASRNSPTSFVIRHPPFVIRHSSFVTSFDIRHSTFVIRHVVWLTSPSQTATGLRT